MTATGIYRVAVAEGAGQTGKRRYRMGARARSTAATGERILDAADAVFDGGPIEEFTLAAVAERAGVTVQTVLRRFGSRNGLLVATLGRTALRMGRDRKTPSGDPEAAIDNLVDHYDRFGSRILRLLAAEEGNRALRTAMSSGRGYHRRWCEKAFPAALAGLHGAKRKRRIAQLVTVSDVYAWKIMRHDRELSSGQTKLAMRELVEALTETGA